MASKKEDIDAYLRKNALKKKKTEDDEEASEDLPKGPPAGKTPMGYFNHRTRNYFLAVAAISAFVSVTVLVGMYNDETTVAELVRVAAIITGAIFLIPTIIHLFRRATYANWINNKHYKLEGWDKFLGDRTQKFWDESYFVGIRIKIELNGKAGPSEHEAARLFMKKWEEHWDEGYREVGFFKSGTGIPNDLKAVGAGLKGDVSTNQLGLVVKMMGRKFLPLASMLGDPLLGVKITSNNAEKKYHYDKKRDSDRESWSSRHS